jgi:hypothetical protein
MPSRAFTLGIVAVWLAAVGWVGYREWWAESGPPALLDRTDEVGKQLSRWRVYRDGVDAGPGVLNIWRERGSHLFTLLGEFTPNEAFTFGGLTVMRLGGQYEVTARGRLRAVGCRAALEPERLPFPAWVLRRLRGGEAGGEREARMRGRLEGARFTAEVRRGAGSGPEPVEAEVAGDVMNLLQPLHRLDGLREGQRWRTAAFDPLAAALRPGPGGGWPLRVLQAAVTQGTLDWHDQRRVPCWRVEYREGDLVRARVWARADDGLVLRQEILHPDDTRTDLVRDPLRGALRTRFPKLIP